LIFSLFVLGPGFGNSHLTWLVIVCEIIALSLTPAVLEDFESSNSVSQDIVYLDDRLTIPSWLALQHRACGVTEES
jgi:hypothetical protein